MPWGMLEVQLESGPGLDHNPSGDEGGSLSEDEGQMLAHKGPLDPADVEAARQEAGRRQKLAARARKQHADPAHAGMQALRNGAAKPEVVDVGTLTLADQEAIALRILGAQARR